MKVRQFRLPVAGELAESQVDVLFDRADDACVEVLPAELSDLPSGGPAGGPVAWVAFDRMAPAMLDAVVSGVRDLDVAGIVAAAVVADDPVVTLEVIAERAGRPVEVVRAWDLPAPLWAHPRRPVYAWPEVAAWLQRRRAGAQGVPTDDEVAFEAVALALRLRMLAPRLERMGPIRSLL